MLCLLSSAKEYPNIIHHSIRPVQMSFAGDPKYVRSFCLCQQPTFTPKFTPSRELERFVRTGGPDHSVRKWNWSVVPN